jgi:hypothetical protein
VTISTPARCTALDSRLKALTVSFQAVRLLAAASTVVLTGLVVGATMCDLWLKSFRVFPQGLLYSLLPDFKMVVVVVTF